MDSPRDSVHLFVVAALLVGNFAMTVNQSNISSVYFLIASDFGTAVTGLGLLTSAFFLAYALFEVPGGVLAAKFGPRTVVIAGALINTSAVLASSATSSFALFLALRFLAGLGFALAFPSILVLIVRNYHEASPGFAVSMMSISGAIGSVAALFGWALLSQTVGWRTSIVISGALDLAACAVMFLTAPQRGAVRKPSLKLSQLRSVVTDRVLARLALADFGLGATSGLVSYFMVYYLEAYLGLPPGQAGLIASISAVLPLFSAPVAGRLFDRAKDARPLFIATAAFVSFGTALSGYPTISAAVATVVIVGLARGMSSPIILAAAREIASEHPEYESLTVAWVDSFALAGIFVAPLYYSLAVVNFGYPAAWVLGGTVAIILAIPILTIPKESIGRRRARFVIQPAQD